MKAQSFNLLIAAEDEANDAFDWYESEQLDLGDEFRDEVKLALARIVSNPLQYGIVHSTNIRRARVHRFPYSILYRALNDSVLVLSIFHEKRDPAIWHGRID
jgi:plasmid stabilization system protein ParE